MFADVVALWPLWLIEPDVPGFAVSIGHDPADLAPSR